MPARIHNMTIKDIQYIILDLDSDFAHRSRKDLASLWTWPGHRDTQQHCLFSSASSSTSWCGKHVSGEVESESFFSHGYLPSPAQTRIGRVLVVLISGSLNEFVLEETSTLNKLSRDGSVEKHWVVLLFILPSANLHVYKSSVPNSYPLPYSRGSIYRVT